MIAILSPAKTLNFEQRYTDTEYTRPVFKKKALEIIELLREYSPLELSGLMKINDQLAEVNFFRHLQWKEEHDIENSKQALLAYHGAVYQGLNAQSFKRNQLEYAQKHLRILSGLYGVLRPLDLVQPYRLEMGTKLKNSRGKDLYVFWKEAITSYFNDELNNLDNKLLLNLASNEYSSVIDFRKLNGEVITPVFKEYKQGTYKNVTIYAKRARGLMARFIIENKIDEVEKLKEFEEEGYEFNKALSSSNELVFTR
ncbi:peroxide stress protein YaaA [Clostridium swellfunianum]|uniref:peroxide stress protein YaaA n=1 Tax=Clostridium swellfunianum TaxID=1367462 RepID=UPI00202E258A|nr:peroxide stress protein YaaA [Clostridium swellfunianum]MCM0649091.1 peroxide stress protein YaaA [Clostridium swellfunianum]